mmetsp:Transcript_6052/g.13493  ORF Transcript_6052/g.13493 Transcript_6052/m.13493 type:complete len:85 (+) Transcript_6052:171-425(+)
MLCACIPKAQIGMGLRAHFLDPNTLGEDVITPCASDHQEKQGQHPSASTSRYVLLVARGGGQWLGMIWGQWNKEDEKISGSLRN